MLSDVERKVLRIIWNYSRKNGHVPSYELISKFTGRSKEEVRKIIFKLQEEGELQN